MRGLVLACLSLCVVSACGDDDAGGSVGRGSPACQDWQDALCDFMADECGVFTRGQCDEQYQGVTCRSDDEASQCANFFNRSTCASATPSSVNACDLAVIADPAPAQQACRDFIDRLCVNAFACGQYASEAECAIDAASNLDCDQVAVFKLSYETCLTELDVLSCNSVELPESCERVFLRLP